MGYYRTQRASFTQNTESKAELIDRIEKTAAQGATIMTDWERSFLGSLRESATKWGRLTARQHDTFQRIEHKCKPENIAARQNWKQSFTPDMREKLRFAAEYYKANPPYFGDVANRILSSPDYVPTEKLYRKMVLNKYVQRALDNSAEVPKFTVGTMALVRDNQHTQQHRLLRPFRNQLVMIIECEDSVRSATKGSRKLKVLPVGGTEVIETEERFLKKAKV